MAGQVWSVNTLGGFFYSRQLSNVLRMKVQPLVKFRQFADVHDVAQQGKKKGDTFTWDVVSDVAHGRVGVLLETNTMPETNFTITQGTLTITEAGNSCPTPGNLDNLSKYPVEDIIKKGAQERHRQVDRPHGVGPVQPDAAPAIPAGGTSARAITLYTNGTITGTNSVAYSNIARQGDHGRDEGAQHPGLHCGRLLRRSAWPTTLRTFKNSLEGIHQYSDTGFNLIMNGEIGRYENTRYIEQTNIAKGNGSTGIAVASGGDRPVGERSERLDISSSAPTRSPRASRCQRRCAARSRPTTDAAKVLAGITLGVTELFMFWQLIPE